MLDYAFMFVANACTALNARSRLTAKVGMEAMEDDSSDVKDDHNHNYCAGSSSGAQTCSSSQLCDTTTLHQPICLAVTGRKVGPARRSLLCRSASGSEFMDSDSGSECSDAGGETECATPAAASAQDKFTLDSSSKFRKSTFSSTRTHCHSKTLPR